MNSTLHSALLVAAMSLTTIGLRFLPLLVFRKKTPAYVLYLGKVLPASIVGMLVIYCLKDTVLTVYPYGIAEIIAAASVIAVQAYRRNSLLSILSGTIIYMILIQLVF